MSLNWQWTDKMGTVTDNRGYTYNLYRGNAFMIAVYEFEEEGKKLYNLAWFFADKQHAKNCLGLTKGYTGIEYNWESFHLDTAYKENAEFVKLLAQAKLQVQINLY